MSHPEGCFYLQTCLTCFTQKTRGMTRGWPTVPTAPIVPKTKLPSCPGTTASRCECGQSDQAIFKELGDGHQQGSFPEAERQSCWSPSWMRNSQSCSVGYNMNLFCIYIYTYLHMFVMIVVYLFYVFYWHVVRRWLKDNSRASKNWIPKKSSTGKIFSSTVYNILISWLGYCLGYDWEHLVKYQWGTGVALKWCIHTPLKSNGWSSCFLNVAVQLWVYTSQSALSNSNTVIRAHWIIWQHVFYCTYTLKQRI